MRLYVSLIGLLMLKQALSVRFGINSAVRPRGCALKSINRLNSAFSLGEGTEDVADASAFSALGLLSEIVQGLQQRNLVEPTPVQRGVVPRILSGENLVMSASTGSGKTLGYMLPIVQSLVTQEQTGYVRASMRPRAVILVPTRELARQVLQEVKSISHHCKVASTAVLGGEPSGTQKKALASIQDIVVASPGRLLLHKEKGNVFFSQVTHVVIDEVDTMLMQGFGSEIRAVLRATQGRPEGKPAAQLIMATATLTPAVRKLLDDVSGFDIAYSDPSNKTPPKAGIKDVASSTGTPATARNSRVTMSIVEVDGVGRSLKNHRHLVEDVKGRDKLVVLRDVLQRGLASMARPEHGMKNKHMVFCNTVDSCRAVEHALQEYGLPCLSYHGGLNSRERELNMALFRGERIDTAHAVDTHGDTVSAERKAQLLICTDIAARGLDVPDVEHVVMFDHPLNSIDYIHRAGRTGRAGRKGTVTAIVTKRDRVLSNAIQGAVKRGLPLDTLSSSKRDYSPQGKFAGVVGRDGGRGGGGRGGGRGGGGRGGGRGGWHGGGRGGGGRGDGGRGGGRSGKDDSGGGVHRRSNNRAGGSRGSSGSGRSGR